MTLRTRWHRMMETAKANDGRVWISTHETEAEPADSFHKVFSQVGFDAGLDLFDRAPKFYFEKDVMDALMNRNEQVIKSLDALAQAGITKLPFPYMVCEYDWGGPMIVLLSESKKDPDCPYRASAMTIHDSKQGVDIVVISPQTFYISPLIDTETGKGMRWKVYLAGWMQNTTEAMAVADMGSIKYWKPMIEPGLVAAMLLLNTRGIDKEVVEAPHKLNRARARTNRPPIPGHTIIRVGHLYNRSGARVAYRPGSGAKQPMHWHPGYTAQRWITKRHPDWDASKANDEGKHTILVYVEPYLVNYDPVAGVDAAPVPERTVRW